MLERLEPILKGLCVALVALLLFQVVRVVARSNPLARLTIPALPTLPPDTNAPTGTATTNATVAAGSGKGGTNGARSTPLTNSPTTNTSVSPKTETNAAHSTVAQSATNRPAQAAISGPGTNSVLEALPGKTATNLVAGTNANTVSGERRVALGFEQSETQSRVQLGAPASAGGKRRPPGAGSGRPPEMAAMGMPPFGRPGVPPAPELPLPVRARVYQITDSEILGPVMRPMPMALLGIVGEVALLRSANGQTGLAKEGESVGGLKLLRIGVNRVLVEDEGQKKELMIFSGYGGDSLLPKEKEQSK